MPETMNALLKKRTDAMWEEVMGMKLGHFERSGLKKRRDMFYMLLQKHFGPDYALLDHLNAPEGGAE